MNKGNGELALIDRIRRDSRRSATAIKTGIGDDCAILAMPPQHEVLVTTDFSLEGKHFRRDLHPAEAVGHRCLARGLSDIAAMGGTPLAAFLSLALPEMLTTADGRRWVKDFFHSLRKLGDRFTVPLAGGDTAESPGNAILADIVVIGAAPAGRALRRSGARPGDALYCTGTLGGAAAELESLLAHGTMARVGAKSGHPHLFPEPRLAVGKTLLQRALASSCIDLSDGLSTDLVHLCAESGVSAEVEEAALPLHPLAAKLGREPALQAALNGGEDYELLFSAAANVKVPRRIAGVAITRIGRLTRQKKGTAAITLIGKDGIRQPLTAAGWEHFRTS